MLLAMRQRRLPRSASTAESAHTCPKCAVGTRRDCAPRCELLAAAPSRRARGRTTPESCAPAPLCTPRCARTRSTRHSAEPCTRTRKRSCTMGFPMPLRCAPRPRFSSARAWLDTTRVTRVAALLEPPSGWTSTASSSSAHHARFPCTAPYPLAGLPTC
jgi:hypothetical protein